MDVINKNHGRLYVKKKLNVIVKEMIFMYVQFAKAKFCLYQFICIYYRYYEISCLWVFFLPKEITLNFPIKQALLRMQPAAAADAAKSLQLCLTLCNTIDGSPPGSPVPGILQTRTLVWVAISFSNAWKWKVKVKRLSRVRLLATPWTAAYQAPQSMGFSRQEYWSGLPLPSPERNLNYLFFFFVE